MFIINPGTQKQVNHSEDNAIKVAEYICKDLEINKKSFKRDKKRDDDEGWYGFIFSGKGGKVEVDIPGTDPDIVREGEPFESPRLFVDGSSWLYRYALGRIEDAIEEE